MRCQRHTNTATLFSGEKMAYELECSMKTAGELRGHRKEQMLALMHMGNYLYSYEEPDTALLRRILDALHDLMRGIDTCQRLFEIKSEYDGITKELEARGAARKETFRRGLFHAPLALMILCRFSTESQVSLPNDPSIKTKWQLARR